MLCSSGTEHRTCCWKRLEVHHCGLGSQLLWLGCCGAVFLKNHRRVCYTSTLLLASIHGVSKIVLASSLITDSFVIFWNSCTLCQMSFCSPPFDFTPLFMSLVCSWSTQHHWVNVSGIIMSIWKHEEILGGLVLLEELSTWMGLKGNVEEGWTRDLLWFRFSLIPRVARKVEIFSLTDKTQKLFPVVSEDAKLPFIVKRYFPVGNLFI